MTLFGEQDVEFACRAALAGGTRTRTEADLDTAEDAKA